jgi:hypothetical protein
MTEEKITHTGDDNALPTGEPGTPLPDEERFYDINDVIYAEKDVLDAVQTALEQDWEQITISRVRMTRRAFERLQQEDEDGDEYDARIAQLDATEIEAVERARYAAELAALPRLPGMEEMR